jgi:hypothetical protein
VSVCVAIAAVFSFDRFIREMDDIDHFFENASEGGSLGENSEESMNWPTYDLLQLATVEIRLEWESYDTELKYSVQYLEVDPSCLSALYRENDDTYVGACNKTFILPLFPAEPNVLRHFPQLIAVHEELGSAITPSVGIAFREEFFHLSRLVKGVRVRRIVLQDHINNTRNKISLLEAFLRLCMDKMDAQKRRLQQLENELKVYEPVESLRSREIIGSFLSHELGWSNIFLYLLREYKHNLKGEQEPESQDEAVRMERLLQRQGLGISNQQVSQVWNLLRYWQVIMSIAIRVHVGSDLAYLPHARIIAGVNMLTFATLKGPGKGGKGGKKKKELSAAQSKKSAQIQIAGKDEEEDEEGYEEGGKYDENNEYTDNAEDKGGGKQRKEKPKEDEFIREMAVDLRPILPCGPSGVASWDAVCSFFNIAPPSEYLQKSPKHHQHGVSRLKEECQSVKTIVRCLTEVLSGQNRHDVPIREVEILVNLMSKLTISNLLFVVNEKLSVAADDFEFDLPAGQALSRELSQALVQAADDIAFVIGGILVEPFRRLSIWSTSLEAIRRERVKREGGQMIFRDNAEVCAKRNLI